MSDTVPASAITASLADSGPSFILDLGTAAGADTGDFHVSGAAQASFVSGSGLPLLVDFVTWYPAPSSTVAPPTVAGAGASAAFRDIAPAVTGGMNVTFDHLP
jgi:hypothetical protein